MTEKQPTHNLISQTKLIVILIGCFSILFLLPGIAFAQVPSHVSITNPPSNGIVSSGFVVTGTYQSPNKTPQIIISLAGSNYTANVGNGTFSFTTSIGDGTFNMAVWMIDSNGIHRTSVQFNQVTGHVATLKYDMIVPYYGESCKRMISMGDYSECPMLSDLISSDTSNQAISGHFIMKKDGTYVREKPQVRNHYQFYNNATKKTVCVECLVNMGSGDTVQQVIIEPTGFSYVKHEFQTITSNNTQMGPNGTISHYIANRNENTAGLVVYHDWYVDDSCNTVTIDYSQERFTDAINYLESGCTSGGYNATSITPIPYHPFSFDNPYSSLHYKDQLSKIRSNGGLGNCITKKCGDFAITNNFIGIWSTKK